MLQPLQRAHGRENHEKAARLVPRQRVGRAHPDRLELLGFVGHRRLAFGHAGDQKRHVKAARQVAVGDPVGQHKHLVARQRQAAAPGIARRTAPGGPARQCRRWSAWRPSAWRASSTPSSSKLSRMAAMACVRCRSLCVARRRGLRVGWRVGGVDAAAGKDIGAGRKAGRHGAARHQHFDAVGACRAAAARWRRGGWARVRAGGGGVGWV